MTPALAAAAALVGAATVAHAQPVEPGVPPDPGAPVEPAPEPPPTELPPVPTVVAPAPVEPAPEPPPVAAGYDKGFFIRAAGDKGSFLLRIGGRVQTLLDVGSEVDAATDERDTTANFSILRARLTLEGHAYTERLEYKFQTDFGKGFVTLKDFYVDVEPADDLYIRAGQWKRPFSRQQIASSSKLEFVERAITDKAFTAGRDIGVAIHNGYEDSPALEWVVGVFNGTGDKPGFDPVLDPDTGVVTGGGFTNVPETMLPVLVARVGINRGGIKGYAEPDLEGGPLRFAAAASVKLEGDFDDDDVTTHQAEVDAIVKVNGLSAHGAVFAELEDELSLIGAHAQVSRVFGGKAKVIPALRYAIVAPQGDGAADPTHEVAVAVSWLRFGHNVKLVADAGALIAPGAGFGDDVFARVLGQFAF